MAKQQRTKGKPKTKKEFTRKDDKEPEIKKSNLTNDVSWYARSEQSLKDSASLSFADVLGLQLPAYDIESYGNGAYNPSIVSYDKNVIPGLMTFEWQPIVGDVSDGVDPVNVAALNIYSYVRHANSGSANYDHTDLMMYIMAVGSYFSWLSHLIRVYGLINLYNQKNRYMPQALLESLGINFSDLKYHINDLRSYINHKISEASVLWVPNDLPVIARWFWMNANVFTDGESQKAQMYAYTPGYVLQFQNKTSTQGSSLSYVFVGNEDTNTFDKLVQLTDAFAKPLISDEDVGIMAGDILKAYGADKIYGINQIPDDYIIMPVYDEEVLMQMHNVRTARNFTISAITQDQTRDPAIIIQSITKANPGTTELGLCTRGLFDLKGNASDPAIAMVASRLRPAFRLERGADAASSTVHVSAAGSEIITRLGITILRYDNTATPGESRKILFPTDGVTADFSGLIGYYTKFHWAPMLTEWGTSSGNPNVSERYGEIENYTMLGYNELLKMHRTALYSEYGVPSI